MSGAFSAPAMSGATMSWWHRIQQNGASGGGGEDRNKLVEDGKHK